MRSVPIRQRVVDRIDLKSGERLLGMVVAPPRAGSVSMLVDRAWLARHPGDLHRRTVEGEADRVRQALTRLRERLEAWRPRGDVIPGLEAFVDAAVERVDRQLLILADAPPEPTQLLLLQIPLDSVKGQVIQTPEARRILGLAWQERLENVEEQAASALADQLRERGVDDDAQPDLGDRAGPLDQDDRQWAARTALVEYELSGKAHFQGTAGTFVRVDSEEQPDLTRLIQGMLTGGLKELIDEVLDPGKSSRAARRQAEAAAAAAALREAESEGLRAVRITELVQDPSRSAVTVRGRFAARMPDGKWQDVWRHEATADGSRPREEAEKALREDPRVREALDALSQLGLDADESAIAAALRHGAAVKEALDTLNGAFSEFLLDSTRRLDGPPVWVPDPEPEAQGKQDQPRPPRVGR
jgi:hypothetical protein